MDLDKKVRLVQSWRTYSVGAVLTQGYAVDLGQLVAMGIAVECNDDGTDLRPVKMVKRAADKVVAGAKGLFGQT